MRSLISLIAVLTAACAHTLAGSGAETVLSLQELDCRGCADQAAERLRKEPGVRAVTFDEQKVELHVRHEPGRPSDERLIALAGDEEYRVIAGPGQGSWKAIIEFHKGADVSWISKQGEDVDLAAHLASGKATVFDFYADWCGPCKDVDRAMNEVLERRGDVALRKINVVDWDSPVSKHHLDGVAALPYVIVYAKDGRRVAAISGLKLDELRDALEQATR